MALLHLQQQKGQTTFEPLAAEWQGDSRAANYLMAEGEFVQLTAEWSGYKRAE
jgi:hypothetical protein